MQSRSEFSDEIRGKKYIDNYIERWLKLENIDKPYVECEICGYVSNASIHQHLIPEEFGLDSGNNRIAHLCANCYHELRALIDRHKLLTQERGERMCEEAFKELTGMKKHYRDANKSLNRVHI